MGRIFRILPDFLISTFLLIFSSSAFADGGAVIARESLDGATVTLFASPAPLRAGPADLSVMLQDSAGNPILDKTVTISATAESEGKAWVPPCCSMEEPEDGVPATHAAAQNKLLYAANVIVPAAGPVHFTITVDGEPVTVRTTAEKPLPPAAAYWPYLALPPVAIGAFALNVRIRKRSPQQRG